MRFLAVLFALLAGVAAQSSFSATFRMYNDPLVQGVMTGTVNYDYVNKKLRFDYDIAGGIVSEFFDFTAKLRYLRCTQCDAETYSGAMPIYHGVAGIAPTGQTATINGATASEYTLNDPNNPVATIWVSGQTTYRVVYKPTVAGRPGKTIDFSGHTAVNAAQFVITSWNCPKQTCNKMIDFVLVFDESGSIVSADFTREKQFGQSIANNYVFGPQNIGMALVQFSGDARISIQMQFVKQNFLNSMNAVYQRGGSTCIGCGILKARDEIRARGRSVTTVFIVLTDGVNNVDTNTFQSVVNSAKQAGIILFAIGVGSVDQNQINFIASSIPGVTTSFPTVPNFSALAQIVDNLVIATCIDIPGTPCGAQCQGFCSCKGACVCPSLCDDGNACTVDSCSLNVAGSGCTYTPRVCNDNDFCTNDLCNPATGCYTTPVVCTAPNKCLSATCIPATGCSFPPIDCNDRNPCTADSCNPATGCVNTTIDCDRCQNPVPVICPAINCFINQCNVSNGLCQRTPLDCNDNNECTDDSCDATTGRCVNVRKTCNDRNACTYDFCNPATGCYNPPLNVSTDCNDYNACTNDTCDPAVGCKNTNITCTDNDPCTTDLCNSFTGCYYPPFNCLSIPRIARLLGDCYNALCSKQMKGCYLDQLPGTTIDSCGVCNGKNECVVVPLPSNVPYVIGGALLAVIIIASIIVCAALGAFGGKKGYDIWLAHRNNMSGASTNPLYNDNGLSGNNPMYSGNA